MKCWTLAAALMCVVSVASAQQRTYTPHYEKRIVQFDAERPITQSDIVFLGDSQTENGDWSALFPLYATHIRNRGIIGDEAMGVYDRLHQILPGQPRKIFLLVGVNDVSHDLTVDSVVTMVRLVVEQIRKETPSTELYLQSLLPINESFGRYKRLVNKTDSIPLINTSLANYAREQGVCFINIFPKLVEKGTNVLRSDLTTDGLHLKKEGYVIWAEVLNEKMR